MAALSIAPRGGIWRRGLALVVFLAAFLAVQYPDAPAIPFTNDDYIFLDKTRTASFASLWGFEGLTFHYWRPWSRELHYWAVQRAFGAREWPFHLANLALWIGVIAAYFALARRLAGARAAAVATAGVVAMASWAVPVLWVAGVQDLWMMLWALLSLGAFVRGANAFAIAAFALALLSKETAAVVPAVALAHAIVIERRRMPDALRRTAPLWAVTLVWAAVHPLLGGRLWTGLEPETIPGLHPPFLTLVLRCVLALASLDVWPAPDRASFAWRALLGAALMAGFVLWMSRRPAPAAHEPAAAGARADAPSARRGLIAFAAAWAVIGWLPVLMPWLGWRAYYSLIGAFGAWLAIAVLLAPHLRAAAAVVAIAAAIGAAAADTPSRDWSTAWYRRRAGAFLAFMRDDLKRKAPAPPPHTRMFFSGVPNDVGFVTRGAPALRQWYGDGTLSGDFLGDYAARTADAPPGEDWFFRYDSLGGWVSIVPEPPAAARGLTAEADQRDVAAALVRSREWASAARRWERLAEWRPDVPEYPLNAGICHEMLGDSAAAAAAYARARAVPGLKPEDRSFIEEFKSRRGSGR